jgi:hypothetical protein
MPAPLVREMADGLLKTWVKVVGRDDAAKGLWNIVQGVHGWGIPESLSDAEISPASLSDWDVYLGELRVVIKKQVYAI